MLTLYMGNTTVLELKDMTNLVLGTPVTNAVVLCTLVDSKGAQVAGQTWPVTLAHVAAGTYRGILENDLMIVAGRTYTANIEATVAGIGSGRWNTDIKAMERQ